MARWLKEYTAFAEDQSGPELSSQHPYCGLKLQLTSVHRSIKLETVLASTGVHVHMCAHVCSHPHARSHTYMHTHLSNNEFPLIHQRMDQKWDSDESSTGAVTEGKARLAEVAERNICNLLYLKS